MAPPGLPRRDTCGSLSTNVIYLYLIGLFCHEVRLRKNVGVHSTSGTLCFQDCAIFSEKFQIGVAKCAGQQAGIAAVDGHLHKSVTSLGFVKKFPTRPQEQASKKRAKVEIFLRRLPSEDREFPSTILFHFDTPVEPWVLCQVFDESLERNTLN